MAYNTTPEGTPAAGQNNERQPNQPPPAKVTEITDAIKQGFSTTVAGQNRDGSSLDASVSDSPESNKGRWKVDDFFWLLRPFAPVLQPAVRLERAQRAFDYLSAGGSLHRAVNPLPALAAELAEYFATTAPPAELDWVPQPGAVMTDYLKEAEVALLEEWAQPGPVPQSPDLPPGLEFEQLPEDVQASAREFGKAVADDPSFLTDPEQRDRQRHRDKDTEDSAD